MVAGSRAGAQVPVGEQTLGRIINIIGEPIDELGPIDTKKPLTYTCSGSLFVSLLRYNRKMPNHKGFE